MCDMMAKHMAYQLRTLYVMHLQGHSLKMWNHTVGMQDVISVSSMAFIIRGCSFRE